jgi:hypothetical protein
VKSRLLEKSLTRKYLDKLLQSQLISYSKEYGKNDGVTREYWLTSEAKRLMTICMVQKGVLTEWMDLKRHTITGNKTKAVHSRDNSNNTRKTKLQISTKININTSTLIAVEYALTAHLNTLFNGVIEPLIKSDEYMRIDRELKGVPVDRKRNWLNDRKMFA